MHYWFHAVPEALLKSWETITEVDVAITACGWALAGLVVYFCKKLQFERWWLDPEHPVFSHKWRLLILLGVAFAFDLFVIVPPQIFDEEHSERLMAEARADASDKKAEDTAKANQELVADGLTQIHRQETDGSQQVNLGFQELEKILMESQTTSPPTENIVSHLAESPAPTLNLTANKLDLNSSLAFLNTLDLQKEAKRRQQAEQTAKQQDAWQKEKELRDQTIPKYCSPIFKYVMATCTLYLQTIAQQNGDTLDITKDLQLSPVIPNNREILGSYQLHNSPLWRIEISELSSTGGCVLIFELKPLSELNKPFIAAAGFDVEVPWGPDVAQKGTLTCSADVGDDELLTKSSAVSDEGAVRDNVSKVLNLLLAEAQKQFPLKAPSPTQPSLTPDKLQFPN